VNFVLRSSCDWNWLDRAEQGGELIRQQCHSDSGVNLVAVAEAGAGAFFGDGSGHQSATGALELAGLVLVHFVTDEEFAELRFDVAIHGDGNAVAIEPEFFDRF
jgi:hypothetical protein